MEQIRAWGAQLASSFRESIENLAGYLPGLLMALVLLAVGWLIAGFVRSVSEKFIRRLDWLLLHASAPDTATTVKGATARAVSTLLFWAIFLSFVAAALRTLGWPLVELWTEELFAYLPVLVGGVLIILAGFVGGALARGIIEPAATGVGIANARFVARLTQVAIVVTGTMIGASQLGLDVTFLVQLVTVVAGVTLAGFALAIALGTREHLSNLVGARYLRKLYQVGDYVRVGQHEGRVLRISDGCLFLETDEGDVSIPGAYFSQHPVIRLADERQA